MLLSDKLCCWLGISGINVKHTLQLESFTRIGTHISHLSSYLSSGTIFIVASIQIEQPEENSRFRLA
jgi:hypothetical protein